MSSKKILAMAEFDGTPSSVHETVALVTMVRPFTWVVNKDHEDDDGNHIADEIFFYKKNKHERDGKPPAFAINRDELVVMFTDEDGHVCLCSTSNEAAKDDLCLIQLIQDIFEETEED